MADSPNKHPKSNAEKSKSGLSSSSTPEVVVESSEAFVDFGAIASIRDGASGIIPITALTQHEDTPSVVSWAEVIRQQKELSQTHSELSIDPLKIDSISDIDLRKKFQAMLPNADPSGSGEMASTVLLDSVQTNGFTQDSSDASHIDFYLKAGGTGLSGSRIELGKSPDKDGPSPTSGNISFTLQAPPPDAGGAIPMPSDEDLSSLSSHNTTDLPTFSDFAIGDESPVFPSSSESDVQLAGPVGESGSGIQHGVLFGENLLSHDDPSGSNIHSDEDADIGVLPITAGADAPSGAVRSSILDVLLTNPNSDSESASSSNVFGSIAGDYEDTSKSAVAGKSAKRTHPEYYLPETAALVDDNAPHRKSSPDLPVMPNWLPSDETPTFSEGKQTHDTPVNLMGRGSDPDSSDNEADGAVDFYNNQPHESELTASGTFKVSDAELELAKLRQKILESSAVDLSSNPSFNSFIVGKKKTRTPTPESVESVEVPAPVEGGGPAYAEPVARFADPGTMKVHTPSEMDADNSMIRRLEEMASQEDFVLGDAVAISKKDMQDAFPKTQTPQTQTPMPEPQMPAGKSSRGRSSKEIDLDADEKNALHSVVMQPSKAKSPYVAKTTSEFEKTGTFEKPRRRRSPAGFIFGGIAGLILGAGSYATLQYTGVIANDKTSAAVPEIDNSRLESLQTTLAQREAELKQIADKLKASDASIDGIKRTRDSAVTERDDALSKLKQGEIKVNALTQELSASKNKLQQNAASLNGVKAELEKNKSELAESKSSLTKNAEDLKATNAELEKLKVQLAAMPKNVSPETEKKLQVALAKIADAEAAADKLKGESLTLKQKAADLEKSKADLDAKVIDLQKQKETTATALKEIEDRLVKAKAIQPGGDPQALLKGIDALALRGAGDRKDIEKKYQELQNQLTASQKAVQDSQKAFLDSQKTAKELEATVAALRVKVAQAPAPATPLETYQHLLDPKKLAVQARAEAEKIIADPKQSDEARAQAKGLKALALIAEGDLVGAKQVHSELVKAPNYNPALPWAKDLAAGLATASDPKEALKTIDFSAKPSVLLTRLDAAIKNFTGVQSPEVGVLYARRGIVQLDLADADSARKDAETAIQYGATLEGTFTMARVLERAGRWNEAAKAYSSVIDAAKDDRRLLREAMLGYARVNLHLVEGTGTSTSEGTPYAKPLSMNDLPPEALLALILNLTEFPDQPSTDERLAETMKLADKLIADGENLGYLIKADVLSRQKKYNEALKEYSVGIDRLKVLPKEYEGVLDRILVGLPKSQQVIPSVTTTPIVTPVGVSPAGSVDVRSVQKLYGQGLESYFARSYFKAEEAFSKAVSENANDARLYYFLGLSHLALGRTDQAASDFRAGGLLEKQGKPDSNAVNLSLERIQGDKRSLMNQYRP